MIAKNKEEQLNYFRNSVAMTVTLISFGMMFATLFLGYMLVRFNAQSWPPIEMERLPKLLPFISTLVMIGSSLSFIKFEKGSNKKLYWFITVLLGLCFLALQFNLWSSLAALGIFVSGGNVSSMIYAFTWLHAGHIVIALGLLAWLGYFVFRKPQMLSDIKIINVGKFWHFLGVVWLLMYLMLFVL